MTASHANSPNRCAVVTGGAGGIGQAIVTRLKQSGISVAVFDRAPRTDVVADFYCPCDITDEASVAQALRDTNAALGGVTILVNNAGVQGPIVPVSAVSLEDWRRVVDVNLTGTFVCSKAVLPFMMAAGWGRIVNISSVQGKEGTANAGPYAASKAGQIALAKVMAKELATTGITVNCVTPTVVATGMFNEISEARKVDLLGRIPMQRFCTPVEVADMVAWVVSDACSFSTGAVFDLSGGRSTW